MNKTARIIIITVAAFLLLITLITSFSQVQTGHTGVLLVFGKATGTRAPGLQFKFPFGIGQIVQFDNRVLKHEAEVSAASSDLQVVTGRIAVNFHVDSKSTLNLYKEVGTSYEITIIQPNVQEALKAVTAKYTAEELITKRQSVSEEVKGILAHNINRYGILIDAFNIVNFDFSDEFNKAIEAKQTAQQNALKAKQDLERVKFESQQKVVQAQAEADALRIQKQEITDDLLELRRIEALRAMIDKWDGVAPEVLTGDAANILINPDNGK